MARIEIIPLSYSNKDFATIQEIVLDENTGDVYVKDLQGVWHCATKENRQSILDYASNTYKKIETYSSNEIDNIIDGISSNGNPTVIREEVFTVSVYQEVDTDGKQLFTLSEGHYAVGENRLEVWVEDSVRLSAKSGGIIEIDRNHFKLETNVPADTEITARYYQNIGQELMNKHSELHEYGASDYIKGIPVVSDTEPVENVYAGMIWIKPEW